MAKSWISLKGAVFFGGAFLMLLPAFVAGSVYTGGLQQQTETLLAEKLRTRGELGADQLGRRLHQLWLDVDGLSRSVDLERLDGVRQDITLLGQLDKRYSWIGVTNLEGKVLAASGGILEGASVSQRSWFRLGLTGPTAVDVHEAQLLAKHLGNGRDPLRFIDLSAPIRRKDGTIVGVIGSHVDWRWVTDNLKSLGAPSIDVILLARDQRVLFGPPDLVEQPLTVGAAAAAGRSTDTAVQRERWPDGREYLTVTVPTVGHADLPSFGWSLLVREDVDSALAPTRELVRSFWIQLGSGALIALALLYLIANWVTVPLRRLVAAASELETRAPSQPPHAETRYEEVRRLSVSLVRLQTRLADQA
ncbi:HAMP domain-containing protein [Methylobacterium sp. BE186]|uniref:cache domain-containing protein n=1 Tax=Methylobacterium sp. BE186 TaxID=2817715 RepID=UPI0028568CE0|nr:cache domain-containing protein [Methylobacterium sp. BE186]MDR7040385.1 HAMP domain-containing protein [Methylobacterium sp. BE186]